MGGGPASHKTYHPFLRSGSRVRHQHVDPDCKKAPPSETKFRRSGFSEARPALRNEHLPAPATVIRTHRQILETDS